ncbi:AAA family ATPase [Streptomyces sp. NPDC002680]|uniref:helix-turn-helix transcriptional regulator n=1 Tax=Streptomyces sp. NPDC002680 TaxID=3364659 RepID=UPI0036B8C152
MSGRDAELSAVDEVSGRALLLVVRGQPGMGKTTLLKEIHRTWRSRGPGIVRIHCSAAAIPRWDLFGARAVLKGFRNAFPDLGDSPPADAMAAVNRLCRPESYGSARARSTLFAELVRLFGHVSGSAPGAVLIDDVHAAPDPALIVAAAHRVGCTVVATYREDGWGAWPTGVGAGVGWGSGSGSLSGFADRVVDLGPLPEHRIDALLADAAREPLDAALVLALRSALGPLAGNPGTVLDTFEALRLDGRLVRFQGHLCLSDPATGLALPVDHPLVRRVAECGGIGSQVLALTASAGRFAMDDLPDFAAATGHELAACGHTVDRLVAVGALVCDEYGVLRVPCPALVPAVLPGTARGEAAEVHRALAEHLLRGGREPSQDPMVTAEHIALAGSALPVTPSVVPLLEREAARVLPACSTMAARWYRAALRHCEPGDQAHSRVLDTLLPLLTRIGDYEGLAAAVAEAVRADSDGGGGGGGRRRAELAAYAALAAVHTGRPVAEGVREGLADGDGRAAGGAAVGGAAADDPAAGGPMSGERAADEPADSQPAGHEPTADKPAGGERAADEPASPALEFANRWSTGREPLQASEADHDRSDPTAREPSGGEPASPAPEFTNHSPTGREPLQTSEADHDRSDPAARQPTDREPASPAPEFTDHSPTGREPLQASEADHDRSDPAAREPSGGEPASPALEFADRWFRGRVPLRAREVGDVFSCLRPGWTPGDGPPGTEGTSADRFDPVGLFRQVVGVAGYGEPVTGPLAAYARIVRDYRDGDWAGIPSGARALELAGPYRTPVHHAVRLIAAEVHSTVGDFERSAAWLGLAGGDCPFPALRTWAGMGLAYRTGQWERCRELGWAFCEEPVEEAAEGSSVGVDWLLVRLAFAQWGNGGRQVLLPRLRARSEEWYARLGGTGLQAASLIVRAFAERDLVSAHTAVDLLREHGGRSELLRACMTVAFLADDPRPWHQEAHDIARSLGDGLHRTAITESMRASGTAPACDDDDRDGSVGLSGLEGRITALVGRGLTNRQIGRELQVSEKTVENNLTQVFAKTGCRSRLDLALAVMEGRLTGLLRRS